MIRAVNYGDVCKYVSHVEKCCALFLDTVSVGKSAFLYQKRYFCVLKIYNTAVHDGSELLVFVIFANRTSSSSLLNSDGMCVMHIQHAVNASWLGRWKQNNLARRGSDRRRQAAVICRNI